MPSYYVLDLGGRGDIGFVCDPPVNVAGVSIMSGGGGPFELLLHEHPVRIESGLPDLIGTVGTYRLFSERAWQLLSRLRLHDATEVSDVVVRLDRDYQYRVVEPPVLKVMDREHARYTWLLEGKVLGDIEKWVIDPSLAPDADVFRGDDRSWLVTEAFYREWLRSEFTGAVFEAIA